MQRALVLARGRVVTSEDLPAALRAPGSSPSLPSDATLPERVAALEQEAIRKALEDESGNQSRAASRLGISERALRYKLRKYRGSDPESP